jgi:hypothetical protein
VNRSSLKGCDYRSLSQPFMLKITHNDKTRGDASG